MRSISNEMLTATAVARTRGLVPRQFVLVTARNLASGEMESVGLWGGDDTIDITVLSGTTGLPVTRTYHGAGELGGVDRIPRVSDLTVQTVEIDLSQIAPVAQQLVRGHDLRLAKVEVHDGLLDVDTRLPVSPPELVFLGEIDESPIETPAVGGKGSIKLIVVSDAINMLTRTNPRKRSYEGQKRRSGDEFGRYSNVVKNWEVVWGEKG